MIRVIPARIENGHVVPETPLPSAVRSVSIVLELAEPAFSQTSIFDLAGKAPQLRSRADIDAQTQAERDAWGDE